MPKINEQKLTTLPRKLRTIHGRLNYDKFFAQVEQNGPFGARSFGHVPGDYLPADHSAKLMPRRVFRLRSGEFVALIQHKPVAWWVWEIDESAILGITESPQRATA